MPDQYIEVEWNGVRTRVPVMGTIGPSTFLISMGWDHPPIAVLKTPKMKQGLFIPVPRPEFDIDAEYDRDVRGE